MIHPKKLNRRAIRNCITRLHNRAEWNHMSITQLLSQTDEWLLSQPGIGHKCLELLHHIKNIEDIDL